MRPCHALSTQICKVWPQSPTTASNLAPKHAPEPISIQAESKIAVPTTVALRRVHMLWFFRVWAHNLGLGTFWSVKVFQRGSAPLNKKLKRCKQTCMQHNTAKDGTKGILSRCVDCESISPTQGATHQSIWIAGLCPQPKGPHNTCGLSVIFTI